MPLQNRPLDWLIRIALAIVAAIPGAWIGIAASNALVYAIAALTDRDIAELKDMLIWSMITGLFAGGLAAIWLVLWLTSAGKWAQRVALIPLCIAALGGGAITVAAFDWPKSSGTPIIQYQLRLPAGAPLPERDKIGITVWREKLGQGCYIDQIRMADGRPEITGDLVLHTAYENPTMSLELDRATRGLLAAALQARCGAGEIVRALAAHRVHPDAARKRAAVAARATTRSAIACAKYM